jgi:acetolactate synthase-1/2/3 large subunit
MDRVVDRVMQHVSERGVGHVFMVTGGGAMFINDAVDKNPLIKAVYLHHEQTCAMAAVAYGKNKQRRLFGVAVGTSGCGSTNMMTGLLDAWQDGVPCLFISGNANLNQIHARDERHYGVQDLDIEPIVRPLTKAFFRVKDPNNIDDVMNMAVHLATSGNPGPVWIDIPIDIQGKTVKRDLEIRELQDKSLLVETEKEVKNVSKILEDAKRPLLLFGKGYSPKVKNLLAAHNVPAVRTFGGSKSGSLGCIGVKGDRIANLALYYADVVVCLGSSLSIPAIGYDLKDSMKHCKHLIVVDKECNKFKKRLYGSHIKNIHFVYSDAASFYFKLTEALSREAGVSYKFNLHQINKYLIFSSNLCVEDNNTLNRFNIKSFCEKAIEHYRYVVADAGSAYYIVSKAVKSHQRYIAPISQAEMGAALPYAIGTYYATGAEVAAFTGDGSLQMNIQDLGALNGTKIHLYVLNNEGYLSIRNTQNKFFGSKTYGTEESSGLTFPDLEQVSRAYGVEYKKLYKFDDTAWIRGVPASINEVMCNPHEDIYPRVEAKRNNDGSFTSYGFKNMYPFLADDQISEIEKSLGVKEGEQEV